MALSSLFKYGLPQSDVNGTMNGTSTFAVSIPASVLEAFLPGYGAITRFIHQTIGFDITIFVSAGVVIWLLCKICSYLYTSLYVLVAQNYMCSINVTSLDDIYCHLMKWLAAQDSIKNSRSLMAETTLIKTWDVEDEECDGASGEDDSDGKIECLNFSNQEAKAPPRFVPHFGSHRFWWKGNLFLLHRMEKSVLDLAPSFPSKDQEILTITCFGRSAQPIKSLLQDAKDFYLLDHREKTVILRPSSKDMRRYGGLHCWTKIADRPCRPMETVVLDQKTKRQVLSDINEYLHPATPRWYANRGIPYRRGYLFHGPPGTGKTSLSFALAGVFGLDTYVISLLEPTLTEEDLGQLFNSLPRRCVVLLEDIDTAGLIRPDSPSPGEEKAKTPSPGKVHELEVATLVKALKKANHATEENKTRGISLSGLLNAIDGVASHEGRVLFMTTNKPESLDMALIRPGRVDLQVKFTNATKQQIEELFVRMYTSVTRKKVPENPTDNTKTGIARIPFTSILRAVTPVSCKEENPSNDNDNVQKTNGIINVSNESINKMLLPKVLTPPSTPVNESPGPTTTETSSSNPTTTSFEQPKFECGKNSKNNFTPDELKAIAASFASKIPDFMFSPAEIQGFLLKRKRDPKGAEKEIGTWVEGMIALKRSRSKVLDVQ